MFSYSELAGSDLHLLKVMFLRLWHRYGGKLGDGGYGLSSNAVAELKDVNRFSSIAQSRAF